MSVYYRTGDSRQTAVIELSKIIAWLLGLKLYLDTCLELSSIGRMIVKMKDIKSSILTHKGTLK